MSKYALEHKSEFNRLEKQAKSDHFSFENELSDLSTPSHGTIYDAGCGSGIVSRYLAARFPTSNVIGLDWSTERVNQATEAAKSISNLSFQAIDFCTQLLPAKKADTIVCRYVLEHMDETRRAIAIRNLHAGLKENGTLLAIDIDGILSNLYPQPNIVQEVIHTILKRSKTMDLHTGRKLPHEMARQGFKSIHWRIKTITVQGDTKKQEIELMKERMIPLVDHLEPFLKSRSKAKRFSEEYLSAMARPDSSLFYNVFIVSGTKAVPGPKLQLLK